MSFEWGVAPADAASPSQNMRFAEPADRVAMAALWERSVRATHTFLDEEAIDALRPAVADALEADGLDWWVFDTPDGIAGILGVAGNSVEGLFIDPAFHRQGIGRSMIAHAQTLNPGRELLVDVNEANDGARAFYQSVGFEVVGRSALDGDGRPYPLLHLRRAAHDRCL